VKAVVRIRRTIHADHDAYRSPGDRINFDREMFTVERIAGRTIRRVRMTLPEVQKKQRTSSAQFDILREIRSGIVQRIHAKSEKTPWRPSLGVVQ